MYRIVLPEGVIECDDYEHVDDGIECYLEGRFAAFVPYENCYALVDEAVLDTDERSVW